METFLKHICNLLGANIFSLKVVFIDVDVEAEEALVLYFAILCDHQHVLFSNHVVDNVGDLLGLFSCALNCRAGALVSYDVLQH